MVRLTFRGLLGHYVWPKAIHTTPQRQVAFLGPLVRGAVAIGARLARRWWVKLSPERRQALKASLYQRRRYFYGGASVLVCGGCGYYWSHLETTPITGRRRFMMFSRTDIADLIELEIKELLAELTQGQASLPPTHPYTQKVVAIVNRILTSNWSPDFEGLKWTVYVLDSPDVANAVCLPNGHVIVFSGLLRACHNDDQLAFIIGHEVAHAVLGHGAEGLTRNGLVEFFSLFLVALVWAIVPSNLLAYFMHGFFRNTTHILLTLPHSCKLETEADEIGLMFAARACFDPVRGSEVWKHLPNEKGVAEFLNTHPSHETRLEVLTSLLPTAHGVWEESQCSETREEVEQFQSYVTKALKRLFSW